MNLSQIRPLRWLICAAVAALACSVAACTAPGGTKAGGASEPVMLHIATVNSDPRLIPQISYLEKRVNQLSGGNVRVDMTPFVGYDAPDAEQQVVHGVAAGAFDLGIVGTRIFDTLGVRSFQALTAPMLIDSFPLQQAVIGSGIPRQMTTGLDRLRVTGLAVLADGLREPIAVGRPLLSPRDWSGITFATFKSDSQEQAIRVLGARVSDLFGGPLDAALRSGKVQAFEKNLLIYQLRQMQTTAPYVTANLNLWPQTLAVIANPARLARLTPQQRGWLQQAAGDTAARSTGMFTTQASQHLVEILCASGARFANASPADIAGMRMAFAPVYASLEQDPQTRTFIAQIQQLKQRTPPGPALVIPSGCTGPAPAAPLSAPSPISSSTAHAGGAATVLAGSWAVSYTRAEFLAAGAASGEDNPSNYGHQTLKFRQGRWWLTAPPGTHSDQSGTYAVSGDKITFYVHFHAYPGSDNGGWGPYTWSVYRDTLTFKKAGWSGGDQGPTVLVVKPWLKIAS
jgi:TRAP-type C4-dicarboxylate transport system substrate-binding protein